jgi:arylsulfatase A-like enzyme
MKKCPVFSFCLIAFSCIIGTSAGYAQHQPSNAPRPATAGETPNIIFIYTDDLGYGDIGCYGANKVHTPNIDRLSAEGLRFTNGHSSAATCTPSRFSVITGGYAWRQKGTGIARGNAGLIIRPGHATLGSILRGAGYKTGIIGKWHLGLGGPDGPDWNGEIKPGPLELGFDYSYIIPATLDRVPTVFIDNYKVAGLDLRDPILVSYDEPVGDEPTGKEHPELLRIPSSNGHDQTIINGIGRIGYMAGGKSARWVDEEVAQVLSRKAVAFITDNKNHPFFLYYATTDIHVPHMPNLRFHNESGLGLRGDAILQLDWCVGRVLHTLDSLGLTNNTLLIFSSDNGPVVDDGYADGSVEHGNGHRPAGPLRGGKYSKFEGGTRMPFIVRWPGHVKPGTSDALVCQVDFPASFAAFTHQQLAEGDAPDSYNEMDALLGKSEHGREYLVEEGYGLAIVKGRWKYIPPAKGPKTDRTVNIELGNDVEPQLYDLSVDIGETNNIAKAHPDEVKELDALLQKIQTDEKSRP